MKRNRCVFGSDIKKYQTRATRNLCGFRPTGLLHLGHYFSVILPGQQDETDVLVANYHAPKEQQVEQTINLLQKFGVKHIINQTDVFDAQFYFKLLSVAPVGELGRMTQYKSAKPNDQTAHLMVYPVLMVHDVAGYREVMVGEDQKQHLQFARLLLKKYNRIFEQDFLIPTEKVVVGRIKDLQTPNNKMSKSNPGGCLFLNDPPDTIRKKLRKATMDEKGYENILFLHKFFVKTSPPQSNLALKNELADGIIQTIQS